MRARVKHPFILGARYGRLLVIGEVLGAKNRSWQCKCDCGVVCIRVVSRLTGGVSQSCGCLQYECRLRPNRRTHGESRAGLDTKEYKAWLSMKGRCLVKTHHAYERYGGRGITICARWLVYENFLADIGRAPSPKHSLERRDNDGGYSKENCYWATAKEQMRNRHNTIMIGGSTLMEECKRRGLRYKIIYDRWAKGDRPPLLFSTLVGWDYFREKQSMTP